MAAPRAAHVKVPKPSLGSRAFQWDTRKGVKFLVAFLIVPTMIVLGIAIFETRVVYPPPADGPTQGIVWGDHTFATRADFARWLRVRGVPYRVWARRHPTPPRKQLTSE